MKSYHLPLMPSTLLHTNKVKLNFRPYFIHLLCLLFLFKILYMKYCNKGLNKQSSGVRERIIHFMLILMGKWFRFLKKSFFEQPLGTNYVRQPRFHCTNYTKHYHQNQNLVNFHSEIKFSTTCIL
jgi:hypothetical protein